MLGPLTGGFLLQHFYWGSIFLVNVPIVDRRARSPGFFLIPTSKDPSAPKLDPVGAVLSIVGLVVAALRHHRGAGRRLDATPRSSSAFVVGARPARWSSSWWESRIDHPMLDVHFFKNPRFTAASNGDHAHVLRDVRRRSSSHAVLPVRARLLAARDRASGSCRGPRSMMIVSPLSARLVERVGTKVVVGDRADAASAVALVLLSRLDRRHVVLARRDRGGMMLMAVGMGAHDGAGDRVDHGLAAAGEGRRRLRGERHHPSGRWRARRRDRRQRAVVGLRRQVAEFLAGKHVADAAVAQAIENSLGARVARRRRSARAIPGRWRRAHAAANTAFVDGMHSGVARRRAGAALLGASIAFVFLPARAPRDSEDAQTPSTTTPESRRGADGRRPHGAARRPSRDGGLT